MVGWGDVAECGLLGRPIVTRDPDGSPTNPQPTECLLATTAHADRSPCSAMVDGFGLNVEGSVNCDGRCDPIHTVLGMAVDPIHTVLGMQWIGSTRS